MEGVLCLGVRIVELVAQYRLYLGWVVETKELPLDCCDDRVVNEGYGCLSLFIEGHQEKNVRPDAQAAS